MRSLTFSSRRRRRRNRGCRDFIHTFVFEMTGYPSSLLASSSFLRGRRGLVVVISCRRRRYRNFVLVDIEILTVVSLLDACPRCGPSW